jgi:hypothetical protein
LAEQHQSAGFDGTPSMQSSAFCANSASWSDDSSMSADSLFCYFGCRLCLRLAYASETESPIDRCWRQQRKIEAKLTEEGDRARECAGEHSSISVRDGK